MLWRTFNLSMSAWSLIWVGSMQGRKALHQTKMLENPRSSKRKEGHSVRSRLRESLECIKRAIQIMRMRRVTSTTRLMRMKVVQAKTTTKTILSTKVKKMQSLHVKSYKIKRATSPQVQMKNLISLLGHLKRSKLKIVRTATKKTLIPNWQLGVTKITNGVLTPRVMSTTCKTGLHWVHSSIIPYLSISAWVSNGFTSCTKANKAVFWAMIWVLAKLYKSPHSSKACLMQRR